jgi:alpha-tubulin suppressor-like RCC1 family protein
VNLDNRVWTWGKGGHGETLWTGNYTHDLTFVTMFGDDTPPIQVATGWDHSMVLTANLTLYSWGQNSLGQLGTGDTIGHTHTLDDWVIPDFSTTSTPASVLFPNNEKVTFIDSRFSHSAAITGTCCQCLVRFQSRKKQKTKAK